MNPIVDKDRRSRFHARVFDYYLTEIDGQETSLDQEMKESIPDRIIRWKSTWMLAYDERFDTRREDLLRYGTQLGRIAEAYSFHSDAEEILNRLAESAIRRETWIPDPPSVLITAGEYNRRRGNLDQAESRYNEAVNLLESDLAGTGHRQGIHRELGRLFYELGYLQRLRGDAGAARSAYERSEAECSLAKDKLGVEIARSVLAIVSYTEGLVEVAVRGLTSCLSRLEGLVDDPEIIKAGRDGLARRWVSNTRIRLGQAQMAAGDLETARRLIGQSLTTYERGPSIAGLATIKRVEAQLCLAEGDLSSAKDAIGDSEVAIRELGLMSAELAAATLAIAGVIHALEGSQPSALSCFEEACGLPPELHNHRAQGWAWAGRAILSREAGDPVASLAALHEGLSVVQRCGAPVRTFLLDFLQNSYSKEGGPDLNDLKWLVSGSGYCSS